MQGSQFSIETIGTLDSEGQLLRPLPPALQQRDSLIKLYQTMVLTRVFDRAAINLQRTGSMGTYPSCEGQEAIGTGIGLAIVARACERLGGRCGVESHCDQGSRFWVEFQAGDTNP